MNPQALFLFSKRFTSAALIASLLVLTFLSNAAVAASPAMTEELKQLRAQMGVMMQRIKQLEAQQAKAPVRDTVPRRTIAAEGLPTKRGIRVDNVSDSAKPQGRGIVELKSGDTVLNIGGRVAMDAQVEWPDGSFSPASAPLSSSGEDGQLNTNLRASRLWLKTRTPTRWGTVRTLLETDFYGSAGTESGSNSHNLRLRHAFFELNGFTVGQTSSTFTPYIISDTLLDPVMMSYNRQPQVRWSHKDEAFTFDLALENPETTLTDSHGETVLPSDDKLPDIVGRITHNADWGDLSASLIVRQIRQDKATLSDETSVLGTDEDLGWGIGASAKFKTMGKDDFRLGFLYGEGIGRYVAANAYNAGTVDAQGNIDLQTAWGGYAAYRHWWDSQLRSTLAVSKSGTDNNMSVAPDTVNKEATSYIVNLFWTPFESSLFGIEYGHLERKLENGQQGDIDTLYLRALYNF